MRERMISLWRRLTRLKALHPIIITIRFLAATNIFNTILDFLETNIFKTSYQETREFARKNKERILENMKGLADGKSRFVYRNIWKYRATHKRRYLRRVVDKNQYFDKDLIVLGDNEWFVDCGAYKGDTIRKFFRHLLRSKGGCHFLTAFEPDPYNYKVLEKYVHKTGLKNISCYQAGTWDEKTALHFLSNTEEGCKIDCNGDTVIHTETIDAVIGNGKATYIKMDVEGAELRSLMGAGNVIEREHPRLAVSIYHSDEDMVDIIEYIRKKYPFYKLYVRHYTYFYADTVLYAIDWKTDIVG